MKRSPLKRKSKSPKKSFKELFASYGLPETITSPKQLRYRSPVEKGICWYWFARFIRKRDAEEWGTCISCGLAKTFEEMDAGHFGPAGDCGLDLLMDERNVNGECSRCNAWVSAHLWGYEKGLNARYGEGTADKLKERYYKRNSTIKQINSTEWSSLARAYKKLYEDL